MPPTESAMNRLTVKHVLLDRGLSLVDLAREADLAYDRVIRIVNGYRPAKDEEIDAIAQILGLPRSDLVASKNDRR